MNLNIIFELQLDECLNLHDSQQLSTAAGRAC